MYDKPISFSSLKLYTGCPKRWADAYILGNRYPSGPAAQRGNDVHAQLENYFREQPYPDGSVMLERWRTTMVSLAVKSPTPELEIAVTADWTPVTWDDPTAFFRGKIDLSLLESDDTYCIYDWKTGRFYPEHADQAQAYVALAPEAGRYQTLFVYLDQYPRVESAFHSREERQAYRDDITERVNVLRAAEEYPANPGESCRWCPLKNVCEEAV